MSTSLQPPGELDFSDAHRSWPEYRRRFERYRIASGLDERSGARQVSMLVYCMGKEAESIVGQLNVRAPRAEVQADEARGILAAQAEDADGTLYNRTVEALEAYFNPRNNHLHYAVLFGSRTQQAEETNEHFIRSLYELIDKCSGWDQAHKNDMLRVRLLAGIKDKELSRELQINDDITLDQIKQQLRTKEIIVENQKSEIDGEKAVFTVKQQPSQASGSNSMITNCKYCMGSHVRGKCKAYGKRCRACNRFNHFASSKICQSNSADKSGGFSKPGNDSKVNTNHLSVVSDASDDMYYVNNIETDTVGKSQWFVETTVKGNPLQLLVDTGSEVSVLPKSTFISLGFGAVEKTKASLAGYSGRRIPIVGKATIPVELKGGPCVGTTFYVADEWDGCKRVPLLGLPDIRALGLIPKVCSVNQVSAQDIVDHRKMRSIIDQYSEVFKGLGHFGEDVGLELKEGAVPRAIPPRQVPYAMRGKLKAELDRQEEVGVICKDTGPTEWLSPLVIVNKPNGNIRLCLDPQYLNSQLVRAQCNIPTTSEIFSRVTGSKVFSSLDAKNGFHQIGLDNTSSKLTSFVTPFGKYRYVRLPMGICSSPELYHQRMMDALSGIPGVEIYLDDVLIHAPDMQEHNVRLKLVLQRCKELGLTLNPDKCVYAQEKLSFLGHELSAKGVRPACSKVETVQNMTEPEDRKAVERCLGFINYLAKFVPNLSEYTHPLRQLCKKDIQFVWGPSQMKAFNKIKELISSAPTLVFFDPSKPVTLSADSSAHSLGAVLLQEGKPVEFAAKSLTDSQQRYSQIEKEMLAVVFACKRFKYFCWGLDNIKIETDHMPLLGIMRKDINLLSPRLAAMRLELLSYPIKFELLYKPGKDMVLADTLSRSCPQGTDLFEDLAVDPLLSVCSVVIRSDETMNKYKLATDSDEELEVVRRYIEKGWPQCRKTCGKRALAFWNVKTELSVMDGLVFYGNRLVIPTALRAEVVSDLHSAHQGVSKTLERATQAVFFPGIRKRLEERCLSCDKCCEAERHGTKEPLIPFPVPDYPFQVLGVDLFAQGNQSFLMIVDYLTKWPLVKKLIDSTSSKVVVEQLQEVFSEYGIPEKVVSDNGPQFSSMQFKMFCADQGIVHCTSSPLHPSGNGQVERTIGTIKSMLTKCGHSSYWEGLLAIRNTPVAAGLLSPAQLLQGRLLRDKVPVDSKKYGVQSYDMTKLRNSLGVLKSKGKYYHDSHSGPEKSLLAKGQSVYFRTQNKGWIPGKVVAIQGDRSYIVEKVGGLRFRRNRIDIRPSKVAEQETQPELSRGVVSQPVSGDSSTSQSGPSDGDLVGLARGATTQLGATHGAPSVAQPVHPRIEHSTPVVHTTPAVATPVRTSSGRRVRSPKWHSDYHFDKH